MKLAAIVAGVLALGGAGGGDGLVVHEWGTFTVLQDETGRSLPGVNINEETLPAFVHRLDPGLVPDSHGWSAVLGERPYQAFASKGIPRVFPAVHLRMETPVVYFYPPPGAVEPLTLDVEVRFRRGWISEWYPRADVDAPGFRDSRNGVGALRPSTVGSIRWKGLTVGARQATLPATDEPVWLAPRVPGAAVVAAPGGEAERYLFYRGVADLTAPIRVVRSADGARLDLVSDFPDGLATRVSAAFLAEIRGEEIRFRALGPLDLRAASRGRTVATTASSLFPKDETGIGRLQSALRAALTVDGLSSDEADALLATWKQSYFKSDGLRLFFTVPQAWTDDVLPMTLSRTAEIRRVFVGRIEIVDPGQRVLLDRIAKGPRSDRKWFREALGRLEPEERRKAVIGLQDGTRTPESLGLAVPGDYAAYLGLGRFRDALVLDAAKEPRRPGLAAFADTYGLRYFQPTNGGNR